MHNWKEIPNHAVRHIWKCTAEDCDHGNQDACVPPDYYQSNGTPVCECDADMEYICTEVADLSDGDNGDLAFVETVERHIESGGGFCKACKEKYGYDIDCDNCHCGY